MARGYIKAFTNHYWFAAIISKNIHVYVCKSQCFFLTYICIYVSNYLALFSVHTHSNQKAYSVFFWALNTSMFSIILIVIFTSKLLIKTLNLGFCHFFDFFKNTLWVTWYRTYKIYDSAETQLMDSEMSTFMCDISFWGVWDGFCADLYLWDVIWWCGILW